MDRTLESSYHSITAVHSDTNEESPAEWKSILEKPRDPQIKEERNRTEAHSREQAVEICWKQDEDKTE